MNNFETLFRLIDLGFEMGVPKDKATRRKVSKRARELSKKITPCPSFVEKNKKIK
jgi:hypothetical protein